jgi:hypothetical protein
VSLQTEPDNAPALALYTAAGFQPVNGLTLLNLTLVRLCWPFGRLLRFLLFKAGVVASGMLE